MAAAPQWLPQREGCIAFYKLSEHLIGDPPPPKTHYRISASFYFQMFYSLYLFWKMASTCVAFMKMAKGHG